MNGAPIYVVVCQNDKAHPQYGPDPSGPLVFEQYTKGATLKAMQARAGAMEAYGACRVGRVVFEGEPGFEVVP